jgi:hypothetical protein
MNKLLIVDSYRRVNECIGLTKYLINPKYKNIVNYIYNIVNLDSKSNYLNEKYLNKILRGRYPKEYAGKFLNEFQKIDGNRYIIDIYMIKSNKNNVLYHFHKCN